jgi:hypothetical protein
LKLGFKKEGIACQTGRLRAFLFPTQALAMTVWVEGLLHAIALAPLVFTMTVSFAMTLLFVFASTERGGFVGRAKQSPIIETRFSEMRSLRASLFPAQALAMTVWEEGLLRANSLAPLVFTMTVSFAMTLFVIASIERWVFCGGRSNLLLLKLGSQKRGSSAGQAGFAPSSFLRRHSR